VRVVAVMDDIMPGARDVTQRGQVTVLHISHRWSYSPCPCRAASRHRYRNVYSDSRRSEKRDSRITNVSVFVSCLVGHLLSSGNTNFSKIQTIDVFRLPSRLHQMFLMHVQLSPSFTRLIAESAATFSSHSFNIIDMHILCNIRTILCHDLATTNILSPLSQ